MQFHVPHSPSQASSLQNILQNESHQKSPKNPSGGCHSAKLTCDNDNTLGPHSVHQTLSPILPKKRGETTIPNSRKCKTKKTRKKNTKKTCVSLFPQNENEDTRKMPSSARNQSTIRPLKTNMFREGHLGYSWITIALDTTLFFCCIFFFSTSEFISLGFFFGLASLIVNPNTHNPNSKFQGSNSKLLKNLPLKHETVPRIFLVQL